MVIRLSKVIAMYFTIKFDSEPLFDAIEIEDIRTDAVLPPKLATVEA